MPTTRETMSREPGPHREPGPDGAQAPGRVLSTAERLVSPLGRRPLRTRFLLVGVTLLVALAAGVIGYLSSPSSLAHLIEAIALGAGLLALGLFLSLYISIAVPIRRMA